jgi:predicted NACHT family NTPase
MQISKRSLKASKDGVQLASRAILRFPTKIDFAAELEISRSTVQNFFAGKPVGRENFHKICQELDLPWQKVAELPQELLELTINNQAEINQEEELVAENIDFHVDSLVRECRCQITSRILSMCGAMRVLDMSYPMNIKDIYVNTQVHEKIKGRRRLEIDSIRALAEQKTSSFDLEEVLKQVSGLAAAMHYSKLIVLGKPGSGKTMFLKHLTLLCLEEKFEPERIPIFISLRDFIAYDSSANLLNYIVKQLNKDSQPIEESQIKQLLNQGRFFIAIDGLDEIKTSARPSFCQYLRRFTEWFPNNRYLISCRLGVQYCNFEQFTEVEIADFQPQQIADFTAKWFDSENNQISTDFLQKLKQNNLTQEFSTNPLLLTLLCILFDESGDFPASRSEIYEEGLDIVLRQWDAERSIEREISDGLSLTQEKELLCAIALKTFEGKQHLFKAAELKFYIASYIINSLDTDTLKINPQTVLKSLEAKHGLIVEQAKKVYSFSHLAFQEYLTAKKFVFEDDLAVSTAMLERLVQQMTDERWREVFLLVAEMSLHVDILLQMMSQQINLQIAQDSELNAFLDWVDYKAQLIETQKSLVANLDNNFEETQIQPATIRAFYFGLGLSQSLGNLNNSFDLALSFDPNFGSKLNSNLHLALDLSLFHVSNLADHVRSIQFPALTFQRTLNRAITYATKIQPELAKELREIEQQLPSPNENMAQFWHWWHQQGKSYTNRINSVSAQYCNMGYRWGFNSQQQESLKQYCRANLLLLDCLKASSHVSPEIRQKIESQLFTLTNTEENESQIKLVLRQSIA